MSSNPDNTIHSIIRIVESNENSNIRLNANGGNSILVVCNPLEECAYIDSMRNNLNNDHYMIIDINDLLSKFISENREDIEKKFELLQGSVNQIFKVPSTEVDNDLFGLIIDKISDSIKENKVPVLIHTGVLYGTGIDNIHIMESETIMNAKLPLIILYPATTENGQLMYLGKRPASQYRCMIIQ